MIRTTMEMWSCWAEKTFEILPSHDNCVTHHHHHHYYLFIPPPPTTVPVHPSIVVLFEIKENPFFCCSFVGSLTAHCQIEKKTTTHTQCPGELEMSEKRRLLEAAQLLCLNSNKTNIF